MTTMADVWSAAWSGDVDAVKACIESDKQVVEKQGFVNEKFRLLLNDGQFDAVGPLGNVENVATNVGKAPALHWAAASDHLDIVKVLIEGGACPSQTCEYGYTAREVAETNGFTPISEYLAQQEPKNRINVGSLLKGRSVFYYCTQVKSLLASGEHKKVTLSGLGEAANAVASITEILKSAGFVRVQRIQTGVVFVRARGEWSRPLTKVNLQVELERTDNFDELFEQEKQKAEQEKNAKQAEEKAEKVEKPEEGKE